MNEGILELADKVTEDLPGLWDIPDQFCEKFAELIVRECAELLELEYGHCALTGNRAAESIKKHFGIDLGIEE